MWQPKKIVTFGATTAISLVMLMVAALLTAGCSKPPAPGPDPVQAVLRESLDRQAELNRSILQQNREIAEAAHKLVEADARSRQDFVGLQQQVQAERQALIRQQELIDGERRQLAEERHREPILANALVHAAYLLAIAMCLAFCWYLARRLTADSDEAGLRDVLLAEIVSNRPILLPAPAVPAIGHQPQRALPAR